MNTKDRQCLLTFLKKRTGESYYTGAIDGIHGPLSRKALEEFQRDFGGLPPTGQGDAETDNALRHAVFYGMPESSSSGSFWEEIEFFTPEEMQCKCAGRYCDGFPHPIQPLLMQILDRARRWSGHPITIVSGLRCETWNRLQGGVENSQHRYGEAADVYFYGKSPTAALSWLQSQPDVRYAYQIPGSNNIHFDIQPAGR